MTRERSILSTTFTLAAPVRLLALAPGRAAATTGAETQIGFANATGLSGPVGLALNGGVL